MYLSTESQMRVIKYIDKKEIEKLVDRFIDKNAEALKELAK